MTRSRVTRSPRSAPAWMTHARGPNGSSLPRPNAAVHTERRFSSEAEAWQSDAAQGLRYEARSCRCHVAVALGARGLRRPDRPGHQRHGDQRNPERPGLVQGWRVGNAMVALPLGHQPLAGDRPPTGLVAKIRVSLSVRPSRALLPVRTTNTRFAGLGFLSPRVRQRQWRGGQRRSHSRADGCLRHQGPGLALLQRRRPGLRAGHAGGLDTDLLEPQLPPAVTTRQATRRPRTFGASQTLVCPARSVTRRAAETPARWRPGTPRATPPTGR